MVIVFTNKATETCWSVRPSSALHRIKDRFTLRADDLPHNLQGAVVLYRDPCASIPLHHVPKVLVSLFSGCLGVEVGTTEGVYESQAFYPDILPAKPHRRPRRPSLPPCRRRDQVNLDPEVKQFLNKHRRVGQVLGYLQPAPLQKHL